MKTVHRKAYNLAIQKWGIQFQVIMLGEEQAELFKAISKALRNNTYTIEERETIADEIADNIIMLEQMQVAFGIQTREIEGIKKYKVRRLREMIENDTNI